MNFRNVYFDVFVYSVMGTMLLALFRAVRILEKQQVINNSKGTFQGIWMFVAYVVITLSMVQNIIHADERYSEQDRADQLRSQGTRIEKLELELQAFRDSIPKK